MLTVSHFSLKAKNINSYPWIGQARFGTEAFIVLFTEPGLGIQLNSKEKDNPVIQIFTEQDYTKVTSITLYQE